MIQKVLSFIHAHHMIELGEHIVIGVSGGADSVCLLLLLHRLKEKMAIKITVVHVEHGIRGTESEKDAAFVKLLCEKLDIPCRIHRCQAVEYAKSQGMSLEEGARELRYHFFSQAARELAADKIAVAHNQNDGGETLLFHLARGTGLKGMCGIVPVRDNIIRPLLCLTRAEIEAYLNEQGQDYCTDATNLELEYARNKIRHQVLPVLSSINAQTVAHLYQSTEVIGEAAALVEQLTSEAGHLYRKENFLAAAIKKEPILIQKTLIHQMLTQYAKSSRDITGVHVEQVRGLFDKQTGRQVSLPYQMEARRTYEGIQIERCLWAQQEPAIHQELKTEEMQILPQGEWTVYSRIIEKKPENLQIPKKRYTKWFDYDKINGNLLLRSRKQGDYFIIDALSRRQKLKDYFINEKVPAKERDNIWLLADGSHIIWAIGYRISEDCKVTKHTKRILEVQVNGGKAHE